MLRILGLILVLAAAAACGGEPAPQDQASRRVLANPYNPRVKGNVYHSGWKKLELEFPTRLWRVESGSHALHLVARDRFSQVLLDSRWRLGGGGSLSKLAREQLARLGMRDFQVLSEEPARHQGLDALVVTAQGQFELSGNLRVDRKARIFVTESGRRLIWLAYISTLPTFDEHLSAVLELQRSLVVLSAPRTQTVTRGRYQDAGLDVALREVTSGAGL
jgi:hypothetical protein